MKHKILLTSLFVVLALLTSLSLPTAEVKAQGVVLVVRIWDNQNYTGTLLVDRYELNCVSRSYGNSNMATTGINDRAESGAGYNACVKLRVYEHINHGGAVLTCSAACSSFGVLNNQVSSYSIGYN